MVEGWVINLAKYSDGKLDIVGKLHNNPTNHGASYIFSDRLFAWVELEDFDMLANAWVLLTKIIGVKFW